MKRSFAYICVLSISLSLIIFLLNSPQPYYFVASKYKSEYLATCNIHTVDGGSGTGTLLSTGFILTAGHVVDWNNNKKMDDYERFVEVDFLDRFGVVISEKCRVVVLKINNLVDFCILEPLNFHSIKSSIKLNSGWDTKVGDPVFSIGCKLGRPPSLSKGLVSTRDGGNYRASLNSFSGDSGAAIYNTEGQILGVVKAIPFAPSTQSLVLPVISEEGGKPKITRSIVVAYTYFNRVPNWTTYSSSHDIVMSLEMKQLEWLVEERHKSLNIDWLTYIKMAMQIMVVLCATIILRENLLG